MTAVTPSSNRYLERPAPSSLADVVDVITDQGMVIDIWSRMSFAGVEILFVDGRAVIASIDTYMRFAGAAARVEAPARG